MNSYLYKMRKNTHFTLIELSVVLMVVSILFVTIFAGSTMIRKSKLKRIITEITDLRISVGNFRGAYLNSIPGDFSRGYQFWGSQCGTDASAPTGCNGNESTYIGYASYEGSVSESYRFWQHLYLAEMSDFAATGVKASSAPYSNSDNMQKSQSFTGTLYWPQGPFFWDKTHFHSSAIGNNNIFILGGTTTLLEPPVGAGISPYIAYHIDDKIDDGKPRTGRLKAYNYYDASNGWDGSQSGNVSGQECDSFGHNTSEATDALLLAAEYTIAIDSHECILIFDF